MSVAPKCLRINSIWGCGTSYTLSYVTATSTLNKEETTTTTTTLQASHQHHHQISNTSGLVEVAENGAQTEQRGVDDLLESDNFLESVLYQTSFKRTEDQVLRNEMEQFWDFKFQDEKNFDFLDL